MYCVQTSARFDSAHFLAGYHGKCANLHGHSWVIEAQAGSDTLSEQGEKRGMVLDFGDFKALVRDCAEQLDHALLYEEGTLKPETVAALEAEQFRLVALPFRPTAENLAKYFYDKLKADGVPVLRVICKETPENIAVYEEI